MKTVFGALGGALGSTLACWRLVLILWLVNALLAWVVVSPLLGAINATWGHNPLADGMLEAFDNESWIDFGTARGEARDAVSANARTVALPWILLWTVLSGGVVARLVDRKAHRSFLAACGTFAHRFLWLTVVAGLVLWGLHVVNDGLTRLVTSWLVDDGYDTTAGTLGWTMTVKQLLALGLLGLVTTSTRFARLRVIVLGERFAPLAWLRAFASVLRRLPSITLGRVLSLWPLVVIWFLFDLASSSLLLTEGPLTGVRTGWRMGLVFQATQLLIQAALVYRMAVDVRLWPLVAPPEAPDARLPEGVAPAPVAPGAPPAAEESLPGSVGVAPEDQGDDPPAPAMVPAVVPAAVILALALVAPTLSAQTDGSERPSGGRAEIRGRYVLDVTLDLSDHTATARGTATFLNTTDRAVPDLWLHLYPAAFAHTETIWMETSTRSKVTDRGPVEGGTIDVRSVALDGGADLAASTTIEDSLMHVELPAPVAPGGEVTLRMEWVTRFPRVIARMGVTGSQLDGMQWFPKFCAHDADGWHADPFYGRGEFYADFADFDVTFRFPRAVDEVPVELEATGVPGADRDEGERTVRRYQARDVHDFAFTANPAFVRIPDTVTDPALGLDIEVVYLCQPYAVPRSQAVLDAVRTFLLRSAEWWMPYPYERLVVDGLPSVTGGGMEYPMLFTISQRQPNHLDSLTALWEDPVSVTAHEFAHQYFYGLLASNEVEEAWLDEGFTQWATNQLVEAHFPDAGTTDALTFMNRVGTVDLLNGGLRGSLPGAGEVLSLQHLVGWSESPFHDADHKPAGRGMRAPTLLGFTVPHVGTLRLPDMSARRLAWGKPSYAGVAREAPLATPSREFSGSGYGGLVYRKTSFALATLERHLGQDEMRRVMREYVQRFAFRHPTKNDFLGTVSELTGGRHDGLLTQLVETRGTVDWAVMDVTCRSTERVGYAPQEHPGDPVRWEGEGSADAETPPWYERLWSFVFTTPLPGSTPDEAPSEPGPPGLAAGQEGDGQASGADDPEAADAAWRSRYVVRQLGDVEAPVVVEARFADGEVLRETWDGRGGFRWFEHRTDSKLVEVVVDPERLFAIDLDVNNNGHRLKAVEDTPAVLEGLAHFHTQTWLDGWALVF